MKWKMAVVLAAVVFSFACGVHADYAVWDTGAWPESWPKELEPLRKQSRSIRGSKADIATHQIPFTERDDFESAWPHLLAVKTKGAPIVLVRSPSSHWHFGKTEAGVLIHSPPAGTEESGPNPRGGTVTDRWLRTTYIELVADGTIVDLNRIRLPEETPIIDQRFDDLEKQSVNEKGE